VLDCDLPGARHLRGHPLPLEESVAPARRDGLKVANNLFDCVPGAFRGRVPGPAWLDEDSRSPWTGFPGPGHDWRDTLCCSSSYESC
jgi:hypothetical protein